MAVEIKVGPPQLAIHQGYTVLVTDPDGQMSGSTDKGLYFFDTRVVSAYALYANGESWDLLNSGAPAHYGAKIFLTNKLFPSEGGDVMARTLGLVLSRVIDGGMHERFELSNNGRQPIHFNLEVALRSDFSDIFEVKSGRIVRRGRISTKWSEDRGELTTAYYNGAFSRSVAIRAKADTPATYANGRISFPLQLAPGEIWTGSLLYDLVDGDRRFTAPDICELEVDSPPGRALRQWRDCCLQVETSVPGFRQLFDQAVEDLAALRLPVEVYNTVAYGPAAGVAWFVALFGRSSC